MLKRFGLLFVAALVLAGPANLRTLAQGVVEDPDTGFLYTQIPPTVDIRMPKDIESLDRDAQRAARDRQNRARRTRTDMNRTVGNILSGSIPIGSQQRLFSGWFQFVIFAEMTQLDSEALREIPKLRQRFFSSYMQRRNMPPAVHNQLVQLTLAEMRKIVSGNYHPAARINAMLIIGNLNATEAVTSGGTRSPPRPLPEAFIDLVNAFNDENQIDAVRAVALVGILRHASLDGQVAPGDRMEPNTRNPVIAEMLKMVQTKEPPVVKKKEPDVKSQRSAGGHLWMQQRAIEILGAFRDVGVDGAVANLLKEIIGDESYPISFRCNAAVAYGKLNFPPNSVDPSEMAYEIASLAAEGCRQEIARLLEILEEAGYTDLNNIPRRYDRFFLEPSRRIVKQYVLCAQTGVGLEPTEGMRQYTTSDNHKEFVEKIAEMLEKLMQATDPRKGDPRMEIRRFKAYIERQLSLMDRELVAFRNDGAPAGGPGGEAPADDIPADDLPILPPGPADFTTP